MNERDTTEAAGVSIDDALTAGVEMYNTMRERAMAAEAALEAEKEAHEETLQRAVRAEVALFRRSNPEVTRGASLQFEEFVRDSVFQSLRAFQLARSNMQGWPDTEGMEEVELGLARLHAMALRFIAQPSPETYSKTG